MEDFEALEEKLKDSKSIIDENLLQGEPMSRFLNVLGKVLYQVEQGNWTAEDTEEMVLNPVRQAVEEAAEKLPSSEVTYKLIKINTFLLIKVYKVCQLLANENPIKARICTILSALGFRLYYFLMKSQGWEDEAHKKKLVAASKKLKGEARTFFLLDPLAVMTSNKLSKKTDHHKLLEEKKFKTNPYNKIDEVINSVSAVPITTDQSFFKKMKNMGTIVCSFATRCANIANYFYAGPNQKEPFSLIRVKSYIVQDERGKRIVSPRRIEDEMKPVWEAQTQAREWSKLCNKLLLKFQDLLTERPLSKVQFSNQALWKEEVNPAKVSLWKNCVSKLTEGENTLVLFEHHFTHHTMSTRNYILGQQFENLNKECPALAVNQQHHFNKGEGSAETRLFELEMAVVACHKAAYESDI